MGGANSTPAMASGREPSAAVRGDPMLAAVAAVEAAAQLAASGTGGPALSTAPAPDRAAEAQPKPPHRRTALDRLEATIDQQATTLQERQRALDAEQAALEGRLKAVRDAEARRDGYRRNPGMLLQDAGLTLEDVATAVLNDGPTPELLARAAQHDVEALRQELADRDRRTEEAAVEAQRAERDAARAEVRASIGHAVKTNPEKYELIAYHGEDAENLVYRAMEHAYGEGQELTPEEAADKVEAYLTERTEGLSKTKRYGSRLKPREEPKPAPARRGADPLDAAVKHLVDSGWTRF